MSTLVQHGEQIRASMILPAWVPVRLVPTGEDLWRVVDLGGRALGHVQVIDDARGVRYRARRFHVTSRTFRDLGEFWSCHDAVECIRMSR